MVVPDACGPDGSRSFPYDPDGVGVDFEETESADAAANLEAFVAECAASRVALTSLSLEDVARVGDIIRSGYAYSAGSTYT